MYPSDVEVDDLRTRIANYRQTRKTAAPSLRRWLDNLIHDAEQRLCDLTGVPVVVAATPTAGADDASDDPDEDHDTAASPRASLRYRNVYPFDETAPPQRPLTES
jgi:hypothetical protein